jgi:hypothetical protein
LLALLHQLKRFRHLIHADKVFGTQVFMERPERWTSGRFEKDGEPIGSRTYFQPKT